MKTKFMFLILVLSVIIIQAREDDPENRKNLVSISVTRMFASNMTFSYERLFNSTGLFVAAGITLKDNWYETKNGMNVDLQYRLYPQINKERTFQGMYLAPYLSYAYLDETIRNDCGYYSEAFGCMLTVEKGTFNAYGIGVVFGAKIAIAQRLVFTYELGGGLRYSDNNTENRSYDILHPGYTGIAPRAEIRFGYFF